LKRPDLASGLFRFKCLIVFRFWTRFKDTPTFTPPWHRRRRADPNGIYLVAAAIATVTAIIDAVTAPTDGTGRARAGAAAGWAFP
jgi:hypothetical protein